MRSIAVAGKLTLTVSQLNEYIKRTLQVDPMLHRLEIRGEISNLKFHQSGSIFFTLKDEQAAISCVMYASDAELLKITPFDGMRAVASGSVGMYVRGGQIQLYVNALSAEGVGVLYERLLALKTRLSAEGLFLPERKRALPVYPDTVGVVSSPTGAVIHDILNVSLRRDPQARILLCPARVQGVGAADEVIRAIHILEQMDAVSVIIIARGGGSMEDLWTFNEESVVRAVAACRKPVVSAVGHETDVTLCDLASDLRAPTPSAAAECAVPVRSRTTDQLCAMKEALVSAVSADIAEAAGRLEAAHIRLLAENPLLRLDGQARRLEQLALLLHTEGKNAVRRAQEKLRARARELELLSPYRVLSRGYAIVMCDGQPVHAAAQLSAGDRISLRFYDGEASARIEAAAQQEERE